MENNTLKDLEELKNAASKTLGGLVGFIDAAKKDLTPEQIKKLDSELSKLDVKAAMEGFEAANKTMNDFINKQWE